MLYLHRLLTVKGEMWGPDVVEIKTPGQGLPQFASSHHFPQIDAFVFQGPPQPFDHDVIHPQAPTVHGVTRSSLSGRPHELLADKTRALVRVEYFRHAIAIQGFFQGGHTEVGIHRV